MWQHCPFVNECCKAHRRKLVLIGMLASHQLREVHLQGEITAFLQRFCLPVALFWICVDSRIAATWSPDQAAGMHSAEQSPEDRQQSRAVAPCSSSRRRSTLFSSLLCSKLATGGISLSMVNAW